MKLFNILLLITVMCSPTLSQESEYIVWQRLLEKSGKSVAADLRQLYEQVKEFAEKDQHVQSALAYLGVLYSDDLKTSEHLLDDFLRAPTSILEFTRVESTVQLLFDDLVKNATLNHSLAKPSLNPLFESLSFQRTLETLMNHLELSERLVDPSAQFEKFLTSHGQQTFTDHWQKIITSDRFNKIRDSLNVVGFILDNFLPIIKRFYIMAVAALCSPFTQDTATLGYTSYIYRMSTIC